MFIRNNHNDPHLDWQIVNLSNFDSIVIIQRDLFEVRAGRITANPAETADITIAGYETEQEAYKFIDFLFGKLEAGHQTTDIATLVEQVENALSP